jgi:hypothetical protein
MNQTRRRERVILLSLPGVFAWFLHPDMAYQLIKTKDRYMKRQGLPEQELQFPQMDGEKP